METGGALHVLLITSRAKQRWIIPKGHPEKGMRPAAVALLEAREEAGVAGTISKMPIGRYRTTKCLPSGKMVPAEVTVFRLDVSEHLAEWKESPRTQGNVGAAVTGARPRRRWRLVEVP